MDDDAGMVAALTGIDVVVNAIRLREDIPRMALVDCHERLIAARDATKDVQFIHVGGAGALRLGDGHRFWESPDFLRRRFRAGPLTPHSAITLRAAGIDIIGPI